MKTLKEEVMKMIMDRIGVAENEEFEARFASGEYFNNKFYEGKLLIVQTERLGIVSRQKNRQKCTKRK